MKKGTYMFVTGSPIYWYHRFAVHVFELYDPHAKSMVNPPVAGIITWLQLLYTSFMYFSLISNRTDFTYSTGTASPPPSIWWWKNSKDQSECLIQRYAVKFTWCFGYMSCNRRCHVSIVLWRTRECANRQLEIFHARFTSAKDPIRHPQVLLHCFHHISITAYQIRFCTEMRNWINFIEFTVTQLTLIYHFYKCSDIDRTRRGETIHLPQRVRFHYKDNWRFSRLRLYSTDRTKCSDRSTASEQ